LAKVLLKTKVLSLRESYGEKQVPVVYYNISKYGIMLVENALFA